ncbi:MAG: 6-bladed beta-propeller, partial [Runella sp.]
MSSFHFLFFLILASSCNNEDKNDQEIVQRISISENLCKVKYNLDTLISEFKIVFLEYPKVISDVDKVAYFDDKMYILDKKGIALLEFNKDGEFIKQIGSLGAGPGEYLNLSDVEIDTINGDIFVLSSEKRTLIKYDKNGSYISEQKLPVFAYSFTLIKDGFLFFLNSNPNELSGTCDVIVCNKELKVKSKLMCPDKSSDWICTLSGIVANNEKGIVMSKSLSNEISYFEKNKIKPKYWIDFGKAELPDEYKLNFAKYARYAPDYQYLSKPIFENDNYIAFYYMSKNR